MITLIPSTNSAIFLHLKYFQYKIHKEREENERFNVQVDVYFGIFVGIIGI